jgi:hypothetical protein
VTPEETGKLLGICAAFDNRNVDHSAVFAWYSAIKELPYPECESAVIAHYSDSREWIMPADVRTRVRRSQRDLAEHGRIHELIDPAAYRREVDTADSAFLRKLAARTDSAFLRKLAARTGGELTLKAPPEPYSEAAE